MFIVYGSGFSIYRELDQDMYFEALALYEIVFASGLLWSNLNLYIATVTTIVYYVFNLNFFKIEAKLLHLVPGQYLEYGSGSRGPNS